MYLYVYSLFLVCWDIYLFLLKSTKNMAKRKTISTNTTPKKVSVGECLYQVSSDYTQIYKLTVISMIGIDPNIYGVSLSNNDSYVIGQPAHSQDSNRVVPAIHLLQGNSIYYSKKDAFAEALDDVLSEITHHLHIISKYSECSHNNSGTIDDVHIRNLLRAATFLFQEYRKKINK